ncbi:MAG: OmpA family protein [Bacteroidales bacterium]|jgi:outer membrane protein OmpA-like peptidoglycan-associated protein|nr:OmpA family protein [Bacteroidales bacterium]
MGRRISYNIICIIGLFCCLFYVSYGQKKYPCEIELSKKAEKLYNQALDAQKKGNSDKATTLYKQCIDEQDDWAVPYYHLGMKTIYQIERGSQSDKSLLMRAIGYFEKVVQICPQYNLTSYLYLGKLYYSIGEYKKAVDALEFFTQEPELIKNEKQLNEAEWFLQYSKKYVQLYGNPVPFSPQQVKNVSTSDDEYLASISPDNEYLFFTRKQIVISQQFGTKKSEIKEIFTVSRRQADGEFETGNPMPSPPFNMSNNEGSPSLTANNNYMVFTRCSEEPIDNLGNLYYNCDLYFSELKNGEWTTPQNMGKAINLPNCWESQPSISADGKMLIFASDRPGGLGGYDLYFSVMDANGNWQQAQNVGKPINSSADEKSPFLHSDNKTLYYSSTGFTGLGGYDIYFSRKDAENKWGKPVNIGYPINSENDDLGLFVSTFGERAYFASNKLANNWNIYQFDLYDEARPDKVLLVKGKVNNMDTEKETKLHLKNIQTKQTIDVNIDQHTGQYTTIIDQTQDDYLLTIKQEGYVYEARYIAPKKLIDSGLYMYPAGSVDFDLQEVQKGIPYKIHDIYFETNSFDLTEASKKVLDILIEFLKDNPAINIEIQGHTDNVGTYQSNLVLSENRAKSVYQYLQSEYIAANRLKYKGYSDTQPVADNKTEEGRAKNRRTVFVIF